MWQAPQAKKTRSGNDHRRNGSCLMPGPRTYILTSPLNASRKRAGCAPSLRLDAGELHDLAPLLGFVGDESREIRGRSDERRSIEIGKARFHCGLSEAGVDLA